MHDFRLSSILGALFLTACTGAVDPDGTRSESAADTTTPALPPIAAMECLVPSGAGTGVGELWLLEGAKLERTTANYWRAAILAIGGDPPVPPSLTLTVKTIEDDAATLHYSGTETLADGSAGRTVDVDLKRDANRLWLDLAGTITVSQAGQPDEVIGIRYGRGCEN